jgi:hypothetical protein
VFQRKDDMKLWLVLDAAGSEAALPSGSKKLL